MGGGVSNSRSLTLFVNAELVEGSKYLGSDGQFREIFVDYVKCGQWADRLSTMILEEKKKDSMNDCAVGGSDSPLMGYTYPEDSVCELNETVPKGKLARAPKISKTSRNLLSESFMLANCRGFSAKQLDSIMFSILYPLFASTPDDEDTPRSSTCTRTADSSGYELNQSQRAQELLCACSERTSEEEMHDFLQNPEWVFDTSDTFENFPLSVSVCDTSKPGCPIVYANKAFEALSGYALAELAGHGLEILHGGDTQAKQVLLLKEAVATGRAAKVAVTHYNKKQKAFLDLVAVRAAAHYSISVHLSSSPGSYPEDLKMVDDLLLLLSCVLQAPLQKAPVRTASLHTRAQDVRKVSSSSFASSSSISRMIAAHHAGDLFFTGSHSGKSQPPGAVDIPPLVF